MNAPLPEPPSERRRFLRLLALAGLSSVAGAAIAQPPKPGAGSAPARPAPAVSDSAATQNPPPSEESLALALIVRQRYGQHLSNEQLDKVTDELEQRVQSGRRLRAVKLGNHEEPDFTFRA